MVLTACMFIRVARNSDPTLHMREAKWAEPSEGVGGGGGGLGALASSNILNSSDSIPTELQGGPDATDSAELSAEAAAESTAESAAAATAAAATAAATTPQSPAVPLTKIRSKGTLCVKHEHYLPEFKEAWRQGPLAPP